jgi:hypothetical protein
MNTFSPSLQSLNIAELILIRDGTICGLLDKHPVTAAMLVQLGWFRTRKKASKRLRLLADRKQVRRVGTVWRKPGRPEIVYCRWLPKADHLLHEVELTEVCMKLSARGILRGLSITDNELRPDAEVWINGKVYYLEYDRGTMRVSQIARRFAAYRHCPHFSLWVCADAKRADELRLRAEALRSTALFTTRVEALADPHAEIWRDFAGGRAALPRECQIPPLPLPWPRTFPE